jgi:hypothetical protein
LLTLMMSMALTVLISWSKKKKRIVRPVIND